MRNCKRTAIKNNHLIISMELNQEDNGHSIPFEDVAEAINFKPYGDPLRVMLQMLFYTGCRMSELDNMKPELLVNNWLYWGLGKNQKGFRKVKLPDRFISELAFYRSKHKVSQANIFGIKHTTFRRMFNRDIRPNLNNNWKRKRLVVKKNELTTEYEYQLKGLRKNYQTFTFNKNLEKWGDSKIALEFTSKDMKHSNTGITLKHYVENNDKLNIKQYLNLPYDQTIKKKSSQKILLDYIEKENDYLGKS